MKCTYRFEMIVCLLLLATALAAAESRGTTVALKRDAGLTTAGAIDSRFTADLAADADATAPGQIANLVASNPTFTSITLTWTAPGDDDSTGTAASYDIRYATSTITEDNWASATQVSGEPAPAAAGASQNMVVSGLSAGTTYYFAIKTADEVPNTSAISNCPSGTTSSAGGGIGLQGQYYNNSDLTSLVLTRTDATVNFNWGNGSPDPVVGVNTFSVRWTGQVQAQYSETYTFYTVSDDGVRLWVNGQQLVNNWTDHGIVENSGQIALAAGQRCNITMEYYDSSYGAVAQLLWSSASRPKQVIPQAQLYPAIGGADITAPAAVSNLAATDPLPTSITLSWTAPGDDASTGTATTYDIRYRTGGAVTDSNWGSATQVTGEPTPAAAGTTQNIVVSGLSPGTTYYFAMKTYDELWNISVLSNVGSGATPTSVGDLIAPAAITNLAVTKDRTTASSLPLTWTAPGDDGVTGTAIGYDLRYSTTEINEGNWDSATRYTYNVPAPATAGTGQGVSVVYLNKNTWYYLAIKTVDEAGNWSALSNVESYYTMSDHDLTSPATITNLAASNATSNAVTLTWTASGDDAIFGTSAYYDVRYSTSPITSESWFYTATLATGEPTPQAAGNSETMTVTGLNAGTGYYFAIRAVDEEMNWSNLSNVPSATTLTAADSTAPAAISDLVASHPSSGTVRLTWTAPGDDNSSGTATTYDVRYSTGTITEDNWASARQASDELAPKVAGTSQTWTVQGLSANTTYTFAIRAIDEANNVSVLSNVVSSTTLTRSDLNKPVLTEQDFEYLGAFKLPTSVNGRSTGFSTGGIAVRCVNGNLRFLAEAGQASAESTIYECDFPGWGLTSSTWPQSTVIYDWNRGLYGSPSMMTAFLDGLSFDAATGRFYFSWGSGYNVAGINYNSLGWAELIEGAPVAHGSWKGNETTATSQRIRGGSTMIPDWFANTYVGGRRLGLGFGGYYSGYAGCSKGPFLAATMPPTDATGELDTITLIDYTSAHVCTRDPDYWVKPTPPDPSWPIPANGVGYWGWCDEIFGAGCWIDLPDKHGMVLMPSLGHGHLRYVYAALGTERNELHRLIYDPKDLAAVAQGSMQPWQPQPQNSIVPLTPHIAHNGSGGYHGVIAGMAFDAQTRTLFAVVPGSYSGGGQEYYPLVHGWRIRETPRKIGDINNDGYVNVGDLQLLVAAWGSSSSGGGTWNPSADINVDGYVNVGDLQLLVANWGQSSL